MFLFSNFKIKKWERLSVERRIRVLNRVEKRFARRQRRDYAPVYVVDKPEGSLGVFKVRNGKAYIKLSNCLVTNVALRFKALDTVIHEGRHAHQATVISNNHSIFNFRARKWKKNKKGYIYPEACMIAYRMQSIERDANKYALKHLRKRRRKYKNEPSYKETLDILIKCFESAEAEAREKFGDNFKREIRRMIKQRKKANKK